MQNKNKHEVKFNLLPLSTTNRYIDIQSVRISTVVMSWVIRAFSYLSVEPLHSTSLKNNVLLFSRGGGPSVSVKELERINICFGGKVYSGPSIIVAESSSNLDETLTHYIYHLSQASTKTRRIFIAIFVSYFFK